MRLFVFGMGYTALRLARRLQKDGWDIAGTCRTRDGLGILRDNNIDAHIFDGQQPMNQAQATLSNCSHVLNSVPPGNGTDPVLKHHGSDLVQSPHLAQHLLWFGYLSTTGVYGDRQGAWVDETTECLPTSDRGHRRLDAERGWSDLMNQHSLPLHIFRLPGIYGPGRSALDAIRQGRSRRIDKPGHVFCRIHVDDIVNGLIASMNQPGKGAIYNLADDEPAPPQDVTAFATELLGLTPEPLIPFDDADLTPMGRSFYDECKRVSNQRIKDDLGVALAHPTYREGLTNILAQE